MPANMNTKLYDRWLKDAEPWIQEEDWNPEEYIKWTERLSEAKANLDEKFLEVDQKLYKEAKQLAQKNYTPVLKTVNQNEWYFRPNNVAQIILRPIVAYHFYQRSTFEEIPEKSLVKRVQMHMSALKVPMLDIDVAQMLQYAADKVPIDKAVENYFSDYAKKIKRTDAVALAYNAVGIGSSTYILVNKLQGSRVNGGPVDRSKIEQFFNELNEYKKSIGGFVYAEDSGAKLKAILDTDEKVELFLERCLEPTVSHESQDSHAPVAIQYLLDQGEFQKLLDLAEAEEKEHCSWEATIGPAIKALRRLGRTSAGKDMNKLAEYAKVHQKPQTV